MKCIAERVAVIGLGYVGLSAAVALARCFERVVGFDVLRTRVDALREGRDWTGEIDADRILSSGLHITNDAADLAGSSFFIVTVPTPVDDDNQPDLSHIISACRILGPALKPGAAVVFESTVFPGVTEDVCAPLLEEHSGLERGKDFFLGYSPERINPGDKEHTLDTVTKIIAAEDEATLARLREVYGSVVFAGLHEAPSIKVAEAAKVFENTQRDLNVALVNELALILDRMGIRTCDVLEAAGTKWNSLHFSPGLVGGHCVGIDPYYLTHASQKMGYTPELILAGRRVNSGMSAFVARKTMALIDAASVRPRVGILGVTFKENVADLRNSRVPEIVRALEAAGAIVLLHDPKADPDEAQQQYGMDLVEAETLVDLDAVILAVPHSDYGSWIESLAARLRSGGVLIDVRSVVDPRLLPAEVRYWSL